MFFSVVYIFDIFYVFSKSAQFYYRAVVLFVEKE